jgi:esterase/lipase superfamily enzyme
MVTVYFGTNRRPNRKHKPTDFTGEFSDIGLGDLRFGQAQVTLAGDDDRVESIQVFKETPSLSEKGSRTLLEDVQASMADHKHDALIYVHGFNVSFHDALVGAARIQAQYKSREGKPIDVIALSWPSDGSATHYPSDRHDAKASGLALARGFTRLIEFLRGTQIDCGRRIHLLCHSMGNYALRWAVQELLKTHGHLPTIFSEILLAAADEDDDTFELDHKLGRLPELGHRVSVYFNRGDDALNTSDWLKGNPDRLGSDGPRKPRAVHNKISLVDCSDVAGDGLLELGHSYYIEEPKVVKDINQVLAGARSHQIPNREYLHQTNRYRLKD